MILCLVPLGAWAEEKTIEWFSGSGDMYNSRGEHYCFRIEDDHAVLTQYWIEDTDRQPPEILVPAALGGYPLTVIGWGAFDAADLRDTGHWYLELLRLVRTVRKNAAAPACTPFT